jgi:hypothetical protein
MKLDALIDLMAHNWYGYGTWSAPYWFVGMEPGGDDTIANAVTWDRLGRQELVDCREHHLRAGISNWHREAPAIQDTWGPLIRLLLVATGRTQSDSLVRRYQRDAWGASRGETAIAELSALSAPNLDATVDRLLYREHRKSILRQRLQEFSPRLVVFYGITYLDQWQAISGVRFDVSGFANIGSTLAVVALHPTSRPTPALTYWISLAHEISTRLGGKIGNSS